MEFSELIEHLEDLIALARSERFELFASSLEISKRLMADPSARYDVRAPEAPPNSPEEIARESIAYARSVHGRGVTIGGSNKVDRSAGDRAGNDATPASSDRPADDQTRGPL